jgi:hypothetical protein
MRHPFNRHYCDSLYDTQLYCDILCDTLFIRFSVTQYLASYFIMSPLCDALFIGFIVTPRVTLYFIGGEGVEGLVYSYYIDVQSNTTRSTFPLRGRVERTVSLCT